MVYRASAQNFRFSTLLPVLAVMIGFLFSLATDARAGYLYVLNTNVSWDKIYGFDVNEATGALTLLPGFPIKTGGASNHFTPSEELVIDRVNCRLYALNGGSKNVSAYSIDPATGALTPLPFHLQMTFPVINALTISVHPSGSPLIIAGQSLVASYKITETAAEQAAGSPYQTGQVTAYSSVFSRDGKFLYTGGGSYPIPGEMFSYFNGFSVDTATGVLTPLPEQPFNSGGMTPLAYSTDSSGRLFMVNYNADRAMAYTLENGIPTSTHNSPFSPGLNMISDSVVSADERFFIVAGRGNLYIPNRNDWIAIFRIEGKGPYTTLTPAPGSPIFTRGEVTNVVAINQNGGFLFAANAFSGNLTTFRIDGETGTPTFDNIQPRNALNDSVGYLTGMDYFPVIGALVSVSGRVTNAMGGGLSHAAVRITDSNGISKTVYTSAFGYYWLDNVRADEDYSMRVSAKRHRFTPIELFVPDDLTGIDFIASPE
jgi:6-phosphogluconolactonase (cycloisomerase 2 family)